MAFFDELGQKLTQTSQDAVKKTKDMAEAVRLNGVINDETKKIEAGYRELGKLYYEKCAGREDPIFQPYVAEIQRVEASIREMKETIRQLKGVQACPSCGSEVAAGAAFCTVCGAKMPEPPKPDGPVCPKCGAPVTADTVFCTNCGTKIPAPEPPQASGPVCPSCGAPLSEGMAFCTNCGAKIAAPEAAPASEAAPAPETDAAPQM